MKRRFRCIESSFFCDFFDFGVGKLLFCAVHAHVSWSFFVAQGFRSCGSDQRAMKTDERLRSPFGNLRFDTPILLGLSYIGYNQKTWHRSAENSISKQDESTRKGERFALLFCCVLLYKWRFWAIKTRINQHCFVEIVQRCKMTKKHSFLLAKIMI